MKTSKYLSMKSVKFFIGLEKIYKSKRIIHDQDINDIPLIMNEERFRYCLPLKFNCRDEKCQAEIIIKNVIVETVRHRRDNVFLCFFFACYMTNRKYYFTAYW